MYDQMFYSTDQLLPPVKHLENMIMQKFYRSHKHEYLMKSLNQLFIFETIVGIKPRIEVLTKIQFEFSKKITSKLD